MNKEAARKEALKRRAALGEAYRSKASDEIARKIISDTSWKNASSVFLYYGYGDEAKTEGLIEKAAEDGKKIYLPKVLSEGEMVFIGVSSVRDTVKGAYGIPEPVYDKEKVSEERPDLILVPCVAVDRYGNRAGHGRGYYDRYLEKMKDIPYICAAYDCQIMDIIDTDDKDIKMDIIVTEKEIIRI